MEEYIQIYIVSLDDQKDGPQKGSISLSIVSVAPLKTFFSLIPQPRAAATSHYSEAETKNQKEMKEMPERLRWKFVYES